MLTDKPLGAEGAGKTVGEPIPIDGTKGSIEPKEGHDNSKAAMCGLPEVADTPRHASSPAGADKKAEGRKGLAVRSLAVENFRLQFDAAQIPVLAKRHGPAQETHAVEAGKRIRNGDYSRANLMVIACWKAEGRDFSRPNRNSDEEIADALHLAIEAKTERAAIAVLDGLTGVDVPIASAILTAIDPERFTILDFWALEALGRTTRNRSVDFYLTYLTACRRLATEHGVTLLDFSRALWQWWYEQTLLRLSVGNQAS
jgi:hypothetical protein